jgi:hypothetical protein
VGVGVVLSTVPSGVTPGGSDGVGEGAGGGGVGVGRGGGGVGAGRWGDADGMGACAVGGRPLGSLVSSDLPPSLGTSSGSAIGVRPGSGVFAGLRAVVCVALIRVGVGVGGAEAVGNGFRLGGFSRSLVLVAVGVARGGLGARGVLVGRAVRVGVAAGVLAGSAVGVHSGRSGFAREATEPHPATARAITARAAAHPRHTRHGPSLPSAASLGGLTDDVCGSARPGMGLSSHSSGALDACSVQNNLFLCTGRCRNLHQ